MTTVSLPSAMATRARVKRRITARGGAAGLLAGCALLVGVGPALAAQGVSVDLGRIEITEPLVPGQAYSLPPMSVINPGTERTRYVMVASPVGEPASGAVPAEWFTFDPASVELDPGQSQRLRIRLVLPPDAPPGDYTILVGAQIAAEGSGPRVGAAAAARTTFSVRSASQLQISIGWLGRALGDLMPWILVVPAAVIGGAILRWLSLRFSLRIERR